MGQALRTVLFASSLVFVGAAAACSSSSADAEAPATPADDASVPDESGDASGIDAPADASLDVTTDAAIRPPVACGTMLPGPALPANSTEGQPDYATRLAAIDVSVLPEALDLSGESALGRGVVRYLLQVASGDTYSKSTLASGAAPSPAVLASIASGGAAGTDVDLTFLRQTLFYYTPCTRPLPASLTALKARYGDFTTWPKISLACSKPKNEPRVIYQNDALGVYVAQTFIEETGTVRETEVILSKTRTDGQLDFAVYTPEGELTNRSTFATSTSSIVSSAPYTCMTCHTTPGSGRFDVLFPTGVGAGCR